MRIEDGGQQSWPRMTPRRPAWVPLLGAVLGAMVFFWMYGYEILAPQFVEWLAAGDPIQHFLGWHFFRSESWTFPLGAIRSYAFPQGTSLVYTDSIPLIAIPLKLWAPLLPRMFQYQGLWLLSCYLLQGIFACMLLRKIDSNIVLIGIGTILFLLSPIICFRAVGHESLAAHWVILAALYLYFEKYDLRNQITWIALLSITSTIHFYLLFMVFFLWAGYLAKTLMIAFQVNIVSVAMSFVLSLSIIFIISWIEGAFIVNFSDTIGFGLGYYSMNLLSPFLRSHLKVTPGQYEGFNYLGLGLLLAIIISLCRLSYHRNLYMLKKNFPLLVVCSLLFLISLSPQVTFSEYTLFKVPLPEFMEKLLSIFRASGRMFWPITYTLMFFSIAVIIKNNTTKRSITVLIVVIVVQFSDLYHLYKTISITGNKWTFSLYSRLWDYLPVQYTHLTIIPPHQDHDEHIPFAILATYHGMTINTGYTARTNTDERNRYQEKLLREFVSGELSSDSLYILKDCSLYPRNLADTVLAIRLDGFVVILPDFREKFQHLEEPLPVDLDEASRDSLLRELLAASASPSVSAVSQAVAPCPAGPSLREDELAVIENRPDLHVATDRPLYRHHESLNAVVDLANSTERVVDVYIALLGRDGEVWFWNRGWRSRQQGQRWIASFKAMHLSPGMRLQGKPLALGPFLHLPSGQYRLVVVLTQADTIEVIARAQTSFVLED